MKAFKPGRMLQHGAWLAGIVGIAMAHTAFAAATSQDTNAAYDAQDRRLNAVYRMLSQSLDDTGRKALREEERKWITGRDASCRITAGTVVKNTCTTTQTSFRADELEKRLAAGPKDNKAAPPPPLAGDWAYRSDCNLGHYAEINIKDTSPDIEGSWSDVTRTLGSQGQFKAEWRGGRLFLRFCSEDSADGGYPACPAYGDFTDYLTAEDGKLAWYRASGVRAEGKFDKYVILDRKPGQGSVPMDTRCKDSG
ncbi:DUF1311 domain-containing protein [Bacillus sp. NP157]|nr:DUF1311 domain-containing protein [Bacillus sp. NP157]